MEVVNLNHPIDPTHLMNSEPCVMALGFFDGVHKGHRKIIETAKEIAKRLKIKFTIMTFFPHPSNIISKNDKIDHYISPLPVKKEIFASMGVEKLFIVNFNRDFSKLSHQQFIEQYIIGLRCQHVVAGFDFTYGFKGQGNMDQMLLDSKGRFGVTTISKLEHNHEKMSSSIIRKMLNSGKVQDIPMYLEDYYSIKGKIVKDQTINHNESVLKIDIDRSYHLPKKGLYKIKAKLDNLIFFGTFYVPVHNTGTIEFHLLNSEISHRKGEIILYFIEEEVKDSTHYTVQEDEKMFILI
ncbi:MAG TPA: FAD synthetase family protein [Chondromyces sp.]|nr:FAD synthetase family protein [Chondromyces sp.]